MNITTQDEYIFKNRTITSQIGTTRDLTINDLILHQIIIPGTRLDRDCNCNLTYMLENVHDIGKVIRSKYHFVKDDVPIFLIMDNAGGMALMQQNWNMKRFWQNNTTC